MVLQYLKKRLNDRAREQQARRNAEDRASRRRQLEYEADAQLRAVEKAERAAREYNQISYFGARYLAAETLYAYRYWGWHLMYAADTRKKEIADLVQSFFDQTPELARVISRDLKARHGVSASPQVIGLDVERWSSLLQTFDKLRSQGIPEAALAKIIRNAVPEGTRTNAWA